MYIMKTLIECLDVAVATPLNTIGIFAMLKVKCTPILVLCHASYRY